MPKIFISYNRKSQDMARNLVSDIEALGYGVWFDQDLSGGQAWWDQILTRIRDADVFVFLLDPHGLNSTACQREFEYAAALGKAVLPVLVAEGVSTNLLPPELAQLQFVDYRRQDKSSLALLSRALTRIPPSKELHDPLPTPPEVPVSYLGGLTRRIDTSSRLSYEEQSAIVVDLRRGMRDPMTADDTRILLGRLRARWDLFVAVAEEIDELLVPAKSAPQGRPAPKPTTEIFLHLPAEGRPPLSATPAATPRREALQHRRGLLLLGTFALLVAVGYTAYISYGSPRVPGASGAAPAGDTLAPRESGERSQNSDKARSIAATKTADVPAGAVAPGTSGERSQNSDKARNIAATKAAEVPARAVALPSNEYLVDPDRRLMWTKQDNGSDITQSAALSYCRSLHLDGYAGWGLPTLDQLAAIYDRRGNFKLTGRYYWSSPSGFSSKEAGYFNFANGRPISDGVGVVLWYDFRALCVRPAGAR